MPAAPTAYVGLMSTDPTEAGGGTEVTGNGYARQAVTFGAISGAGPRTMSNSAKVTFPNATPAGYSWTGAALFDGPSGGNMLDYDPTPAGSVNVGDNAKIDIGSLGA